MSCPCMLTLNCYGCLLQRRQTDLHVEDQHDEHDQPHAHENGVRHRHLLADVVQLRRANAERQDML